MFDAMALSPAFSFDPSGHLPRTHPVLPEEQHVQRDVSRADQVGMEVDKDEGNRAEWKGSSSLSEMSAEHR